MIMLSDVASSTKELTLTPTLMKKLLESNYQSDWAKIGLDKKGTLGVRTELYIRTVDKQQLLDCLEQTATLADRVAGIEASFRP